MSEFRFRPALEEVTEMTKDQGLDPYEAYAWLHEYCKENGLVGETYASTSITSGGHKRDESLDMMQVILRNTESARLLAEQLAADRQIDAETTVEPVYVGKTGWTQSEYMEFWLAVIGGAKLTPGFTARDVDALRLVHQEAFERAGLDMSMMNSGKSAEDRAQEYFKLAQATSGLYLGGQIDAQPIRQIVRLIDGDKSLGAQAERVFARSLGIRVMNICVVKPVDPSELVTVNRRLAEDTDRLIRFGAAVFDTRQSQVRLQLVEDEAA